MATEQFSVIYTGKLNQDVDVESAAKQFAQKFKLSPEKALKIINAGKEVTI